MYCYLVLVLVLKMPVLVSVLVLTLLVLALVSVSELAVLTTRLTLNHHPSFDLYSATTVAAKLKCTNS